MALCRAYNTYLHETFIKVTPRLNAVALLPLQDPDAAAAELRRAVRELGLWAPCSPPTAPTCWATRASRPSTRRRSGST